MSNYDSKVNQQKLLTISVVTYRPDLKQLQNTLDSLILAVNSFDIDDYSITIVDNSDKDSVSSFLMANYADLPWRLIHGQGNIGFGRGHNLVLETMGKFHLILNPDVELYSDTILKAISFMNVNQDCGLITPHASWPDGERQYLCKRFPAIFDLLLRGFAPKPLQFLFRDRLQFYEMQSETQCDIYWNPPIVSGCFMFFRSDILREAKGFDERYFLYFEDFDLSLRVNKLTKIAYVPQISVVHAGGKASKKGLLHIQMFVKSALKFYWKHGFKLL
ncbi:glycosyltransferase [Ochrobactrum sp. Marseille-Q0166]|uniref:glycosyltransferase n=1 Tax=Ochrobactrum sp. Marseille-Q0166 TaxID=2761105 RepID=UPI001FFF0684|nr:glycosyltransferase [Ochrobactrum sp. Marseille-Q0166]